MALAFAPSAAASRWYSHRYNRVLAYRLAASLGRALPRRPRLALAAALGAALRHAFPREVGIIAATVARVAPALDGRGRAAIVRSVFRHFAMCFADLVGDNRRADRLEGLLAGVDGAAHVDEALAAGRGVIALTAHLGNWELAGRLLARRAARPTHVLVESEIDPAVERFLRDGIDAVTFVRRRPTAVLALVAALRRGEVVAMQGDRALGSRGDVPVTFFGEPAAFPLGPFVLARATGAPIVPAFCLLTPDRRYRVVLGAPIAVGEGGEHGALGAWVARLEAMVAGHPEQWFNFFDVWRRQPCPRT